MKDIAELNAMFIPKTIQPALDPKFPVEDDNLTIGRHPNNKFCIPLDSVSRYHAKLEYRDDSLILIDLQSSNGTYVNGKKIQSAKIRNGDFISFGEVEFKFCMQGDAQDTKSTRSKESSVDIVSALDEFPSRIIASKPGTDVEKLSTDLRLLETGDKHVILSAHKKLATLYKLSEILHSVEDEKRMLDKVADLIFEILPIDRAIILTKPHVKSNDFHPIVVRQRDTSDPTKKIAISRTIIEKVAKEKISILSIDAQTDNRFSASESIIAHDIRSTMCAPIVANEKVIGILHVDTMESIHEFNDEDLNFLTSIANELAVSIENLRMREEMIRNERMAAVGMTVTNIAHNIKNILLLSKGGSQLVTNGIENQNWDIIKDSWGIVQRGVEKISKLVQDMLRYSKSKNVVKISLDINKLIKEVTDSIEETLKNKNINIKLDLDTRIGLRGVDENILQNAVQNLIVNAAEAITHDHGLITVSTSMDSDKNCMITIEDNGCGIPKENLQRLFFPFFTTKGSSGTGLGLAMTKKEIEDMGAKISCESEEMVGTTFLIFIPYEHQTDITKSPDFEPKE